MLQQQETYIYLTLADSKASQRSLNIKLFMSKWFVNCMAEAHIGFAKEGLDGNKPQKDD